MVLVFGIYYGMAIKRIKFSLNVLKSDIWDNAREFYPFSCK